jgi:hypothetical protein
MCDKGDSLRETNFASDRVASTVRPGSGSGEEGDT